MLSSRYLHLHEALGLGPMWLLRGAHVLPDEPAEASPETAGIPAGRAAPPLPPQTQAWAASERADAVAVSSARLPAAVRMPPPPAVAQTATAAPAKPPRQASAQAAAVLAHIGRREEQLPTAAGAESETALQMVQRLWRAHSPGLPAAGMDDCAACPLHQQRRQALAGRGAGNGLLVLSLNPSLQDDDAGQLFSGAHGQLLDNMLAAIGLRPEQVFRTSWLRCTPRLTLKPEAAEQVACAAFLEREFAQVQPRAVLLLGDSFAHEAQQWLLAQVAGGKPCFRVPHPAVLLRQSMRKAQAWTVLQQLRQCLDEG